MRGAKTLREHEQALRLGLQARALSRGLKPIAVSVALPLKQRFAPARWLKMPVTLPDGRVMHFAISHRTDVLVLLDVFAEAAYAHPVLTEPRLIVDAGAHIGASAIYFATRYPQARVIALEPSPSNFAKLTANSAAFANIECRQVALAPTSGVLSFYERLAGWASSLDSRDGDRVEVDAVTLASLLDEFGHIDLLKLDIEGAEYGVLKATRPDPSSISNIVGEIHSWAEWTDFTDHQLLALLDAYRVKTDETGRDYVFRATPS